MRVLQIILYSMLLLICGVGCALEVAAPIESHSTATTMVDQAGFAADQTRVQLLSTVVGGKNVFLPATVVVTAGEGRVLSFFNTTEKPHGMTIGGLGLSVELPPGEEYLVELPALEGGNVYAIRCHLHGAHRGGTLVVLPGE
jgi:plastocyanin